MGTFYVAIKPGEKPLVQVGQRVKTGDVICIIEAMKSMNELKVNQEGEILVSIPRIQSHTVQH